MTNEELDRLERMAKANVTEKAGTLALVAEVRRLRGLVEAAYHEGCREGSTTPEYWEQTETFKALEGHDHER